MSTAARLHWGFGQASVVLMSTRSLSQQQGALGKAEPSRAAAAGRRRGGSPWILLGPCVSEDQNESGAPSLSSSSSPSQMGVSFFWRVGEGLPMPVLVAAAPRRWPSCGCPPRPRASWPTTNFPLPTRRASPTRPHSPRQAPQPTRLRVHGHWTFALCAHPAPGPPAPEGAWGHPSLSPLARGRGGVCPWAGAKGTQGLLAEIHTSCALLWTYTGKHNPTHQALTPHPHARPPHRLPNAA